MKLSAENMGVARAGRLVVKGCAFALAAGEALAVTGPNGSGKSTLLRAIAGLLPLETGRVWLAPEAEASLPERIHYLGHANALKASLTARENLDFWRAMLGTANNGGAPLLTALEALTAAGLSHAADLPCAYLSAGQKRRVALARLLTARRPLWLLDEPAAALDTSAQQWLEAIIRSHLASGGMVIAALHAPLNIGPTQSLILEGGR